MLGPYPHASVFDCLFYPSVIRHSRQERVRDIRRYCSLFCDAAGSEVEDEFAASITRPVSFDGWLQVARQKDR